MATYQSPGAALFSGLSSGVGAMDKMEERRGKNQLRNLQIQKAQSELDRQNNFDTYMVNSQQAIDSGYSTDGGLTLDVDAIEKSLIAGELDKANFFVKKYGDRDPVVAQNEGFKIEGLTPGPDGPDGEKTYALAGSYDDPKKGPLSFITQGGTKDRENDPVQFGTARQVAQKIANEYTKDSQRPGAVQASTQVKQRSNMYDLNVEINELNGRIDNAVQDAVAMLGDPLLQRQISDELASIEDPYQRQQRLKEIVAQLPDEVMVQEQKQQIAEETAKIDAQKQEEEQAPTSDSAKTALMTPGSTGGFSAGRSQKVFDKIEEAQKKGETEEEKERMIKAVITQEDKQEILNFLKENNINDLSQLKGQKQKVISNIRAFLEANAQDQEMRTRIGKQFDNIMTTGVADLDSKGVVDLQTKQLDYQTKLRKSITDNYDRLETATSEIRKVTTKALDAVTAALYDSKDGKVEEDADFKWNENKARAAFREVGKLFTRFNTQTKRAARGDIASATRANQLQIGLDQSISALIQGAGISEDYGGFFDLGIEWDADGGPGMGDTVYSRLGVTYDADGNPTEFFYLDPSSQTQRGETVPADKIKRLMGDDAIYDYFVKRIEKEKGKPQGTK